MPLGGKAIYIAELMNMSGKVYAHDIHDHRVELINKNVERMGMKNIETRVQDATIFNPKMEDSMDRVLIDAPCSGWGVLHKKPDIRLRIEKKVWNPYIGFNGIFWIIVEGMLNREGFWFIAHAQ